MYDYGHRYTNNEILHVHPYTRKHATSTESSALTYILARACTNTHTQRVLTRFVQAHKVLDGRGEDMFCEARNFFIDFSKVRKHKGVEEGESISS